MGGDWVRGWSPVSEIDALISDPSKLVLPSHQ